MASIPYNGVSLQQAHKDSPLNRLEQQRIETLLRELFYAHSTKFFDFD